MVTPIGFQECWLTVKDMPLDQAREVINAKFTERSEMELAAKQSIETNHFENEIKEVGEVSERATVKIFNLNNEELNDVIAFLEMRGYEYEV